MVIPVQSLHNPRKSHVSRGNGLAQVEGRHSEVSSEVLHDEGNGRNNEREKLTVSTPNQICWKKVAREFMELLRHVLE